MKTTIKFFESVLEHPKKIKRRFGLLFLSEFIWLKKELKRRKKNK